MPIEPTQVTQWAREFGTVAATLFLLLTVAVTFTGIFVFKHGARLDELKEALLVHHRDTAAAINKISAIEQNIQAFRDSDKDLLANIKEAVAIHSKDCMTGHLRVAEMAADVDAIGRSVDKLLTLLTIKRRQNGNDDDGAK